MKQTQKINEVDEIISRLQKNRGFKAYLILNNDGVVVKWEQDGEQPLPYHKVVQYSHHILDLCNKSKSHIKDLFDVSFFIVTFMMNNQDSIHNSYYFTNDTRC
jgi:hypothetical protein